MAKTKNNGTTIIPDPQNKLPSIRQNLENGESNKQLL